MLADFHGDHHHKPASARSTATPPITSLQLPITNPGFTVFTTDGLRVTGTGFGVGALARERQPA